MLHMITLWTMTISEQEREQRQQKEMVLREEERQKRVQMALEQIDRVKAKLMAEQNFKNIDILTEQLKGINEKGITWKSDHRKACNRKYSQTYYEKNKERFKTERLEKKRKMEEINLGKFEIPKNVKVVWPRSIYKN